MIITLPNNFKEYNEKDNTIRTEVISEVLYIYQLINFETVQYKLTYLLYGYNCYYCGKKLKEDSTLDHLFPRAFGGITITDNLRPACSNCNSKKATMLPKDFFIYNSLNKNEKRKFQKKITKKNETILKEKGFILPDKWIQKIPLSEITGIINPNRPLGKKYYQFLDFYENYKQLARPVIVDSDLRLLDGLNIYNVAKNYNIDNIPTIWLENVVFVTDIK